MADYQVVVAIGLLFNFITMVIGGLGLLFAFFRFVIKNDRRLTRLEGDIRQLMHAQNITPRSFDEGDR